jgi:hypothetical protein
MANESLDLFADAFRSWSSLAGMNSAGSIPVTRSTAYPQVSTVHQAR